jgi:poly(A) polymerase/tRNA nucleotidyltransferase (CCA-adding enzyme)
MHDSLRAAIPLCLDMLDRIAKERIRDEVLKTLGGSGVGEALDFMQTSGVFGKVCPELTKQPGLSQNKYHAYEIWEHTRRCVEADRTGKPILRLAILLHDIAKPATRAPHPKNPGDFQFLGHEELGADMAQAWMREYRFSREEVQYVGHLIQHHLIFFTPDWPDRTLRRWLRKVGKDHLEDLLELRRADIVGKGPDVAELLRDHELLTERVKAVDSQVPHSMAHLALKGQDVMKIRGISGGPIVGKILAHLLDAVTDDPQLNTTEGLTPLVQDFPAL